MWIGGVRVIIFDDENRLLMVCQRHEGKDVWMVPGGGIEEGESSIEAAKREVFEETSLEVEIGQMVWHIEETSKERGQRFVNFFIGKNVKGKLSLGKDPEFDEEHQVLKDVKFMTREEILEKEHVYPELLRKEIWEILEVEKKHKVFYTK